MDEAAFSLLVYPKPREHHLGGDRNNSPGVRPINSEVSGKPCRVGSGKSGSRDSSVVFWAAVAAGDNEGEPTAMPQIVKPVDEFLFDPIPATMLAGEIFDLEVSKRHYSDLSRGT